MKRCNKCGQKIPAAAFKVISGYVYCYSVSYSDKKYYWLATTVGMLQLNDDGYINDACTIKLGDNIDKPQITSGHWSYMGHLSEFITLDITGTE